jgi:hypothetical protein
MKPGDASPQQGLALSFRPKGEVLIPILLHFASTRGQLLRLFGLESMRGEKTRLVPPILLMPLLRRSRLFDCENTDHRRCGTRGQPSGSKIGVRA